MTGGRHGVRSSPESLGEAEGSVPLAGALPWAMGPPDGSTPISVAEAVALTGLAARLGAETVRRRLALEQAHEARRLAPRRLSLQHWHRAPALIRVCLRLSGLYRRGL